MASQQESTAGAPVAASPPSRQYQCLVIDTGPLIKNDPPVSSQLANAAEVFTIPGVIEEIRDADTRSRIQTTLVPFLNQRHPRAGSIKFVTEFARKTGDLQVLSRTDIHLIALAYELECERNNGDWRLRSAPARKRDGQPPNEKVPESATEDQNGPTGPSQTDRTADGTSVDADSTTAVVVEEKPLDAPGSQDEGLSHNEPSEAGNTNAALETRLSDLKLDPLGTTSPSTAAEPGGIPPSPQCTVESSETHAEALRREDVEKPQQGQTPIDGVDDDDEGWIVPNWGQEDISSVSTTSPHPDEPAEELQVALLTSDFAMQNVALQMNLGILSPQFSRIRQLKTWVLRCHGCFKVTRDMNKHFCPSCGQATLLRTSSTTAADGSVTLHLKRNFQWNTRGNIYSIPKPVAGSANGKVKGGGKNGWGTELLLAEDQKEYMRRAEDERRAKQRDLMDPDALPTFLSGSRDGNSQGRIRVGAGRNVNAKKRR